MKGFYLSVFVSVATLGGLAGCGKSEKTQTVSMPTTPIPASAPAEEPATSAPTTGDKIIPSAEPLPADAAGNSPERAREGKDALARRSPAETFTEDGKEILKLPADQRDAALQQFVPKSMHDVGFEKTQDWVRSLPRGQARDTAYVAFIKDLSNVAPNLASGMVQEIADPKLRAELEASIPKPSGPPPAPSGE